MLQVEKGGKRLSSKRTGELDARRSRALNLRLAGLTYREIADREDVSVRTAYNDVQAALKLTLQEPADSVRAQELARLDRMQRSVWPQVLSGDVKAGEYLLKVMDRRARLLGLDAPRRIDITALIRRRAEAAGLDPAEAVAAAERMVKEHGW